MFSLNHKKLGPRLVGLGIAGCVVLLVGSSTTTAGETLYNGIVLPDQWPPDVRTLGDDPMPVPYLENPPAVIPIDVGRQLFVDDFLIDSTTCDRTFHKPEWHLDSPVLRPDPSEGGWSIPFSDGVWYDPQDELYKAWYYSNAGTTTRYAQSRDGIHWEKPALDVVPGTNIVMLHPLDESQRSYRDSATVWLDHTAATPAERFKMMTMKCDDLCNDHTILFSADGIHWSDPVATAGVTHDRSTFFRNPFRNVWVMSLKSMYREDGTPPARFRRYAEGKTLAAAAESWPHFSGSEWDDGKTKWWTKRAGVNMAMEPTMWVDTDRLDPEDAELYNLDATAYESLMVGFFTVMRQPADHPGRGKINTICVGFSRDGFSWDRPVRDPIIDVSSDPDAWNYLNVQPVGGGFLVVGDELHFYASGRNEQDDVTVASTGLAVLRRDGFASMDAGVEECTLTTRPVRFAGQHLFVNVNAPDGKLLVEVLDVAGNVLEPFSRDKCVAVSGDGTRLAIEWKRDDGQAADLGTLAGTPVRFRFIPAQGELYSFWVSPDVTGASHGYVAAGGPGFTAPTDRLGAITFNDARDVAHSSKVAAAIDIGSRLELMVDDYLIEEMSGNVHLELHRPTMREVAIVADEPWEGNAALYWVVFRDGDLYRAYYGGMHYDPHAKNHVMPHPAVLCYAESEDGIHWTKPELGLCDFRGSKQNNIILDGGSLGGIRVKSFAPDHVSVFKDTRPDCPPAARYKALARATDPSLIGFQSADGIHFEPFSKEPLLTGGKFDSLNLAFWDATRGEYRGYFRDFIVGQGGEHPHGWRTVRTATSADLKNWSDAERLRFPGAPLEHIYTNQVQPYFRAPHIFVGFPMRYHNPGWSAQSQALPGRETRERRAAQNERFGAAMSDAVFMTSRDGVTFRRWGEAIIRPGLRPQDNWVYGDNSPAWGLVRTKSAVEGAPDELSLYATEGYWTGDSCQLRRYTYRVDGFVSMQAPLSGGEFVTKPITFAGSRLVVNFSTSAAGSIRVEIQHPDGSPVNGFSLEDSPATYGDELERTITWNSTAKLSDLAGKPVRLRFVLSDADLFAFRFHP